MLWLIGTGLNDEKDLSVRAVDIIKKADYIYLESYTSIWRGDLSKITDKEVVKADRDLVENKADEIISKAKDKDVVFLVVGDVLSATTHADLILRAREKGVKFKMLHNASVLTAVGDCGLSLYKFGKVSSIPFHNENVETPYDVIKENKDLHTLLLLDLKNDKTMSVSEGIKYLLKVEGKRKENVFTEDSFCVGCASLGTSEEDIKFGKAKDLLDYEFKSYPQCLIVVGKLHFVEEEFLEMFGNRKF